MKKFFSFVAGVLVALSFASCQGGNDPKVTGFKVTISDITASKAHVKIEPADTTATFVSTCFEAEQLAKWNDDSIKNAIKNYFDLMIEMYKDVYGQTLTYANFLQKGVLEGDFEGLEPLKQYVIVAVKMDDKAAFNGPVAKEYFKTRDIVLKNTIDLGVLQDEGYFEDYRDDDGSFMVYAEKKEIVFEEEAQTVEVALNIYSKTFAGNFTEKDLDKEYSYVWTSEIGVGSVSILKAELVGTEKPDEQKASISGWVIGSDEIKYTFSFEYSTVGSSEAPQRAIRKSAAKKQVILPALLLK